MIVNSTYWLSTDANEAFLNVTDKFGNKFEIFSHPCIYQSGDKITTRLFAFDSDCILLSYDDDVSIVMLPSGKIKIVALIISSKDALVAVDDVVIAVDTPLPGDIRENMFIEFYCSRLDT